MSDDIIDCLDSAKNNTSNIMVVGVGGGGGNAVKYMYNLGIHNVMFMVCNTDIQALSRSPIPLKIQLGRDLTSGLGAGNKPERGRDAAIESGDEIRENLIASGARMVFITAGMGGGTGTGAAPVIAQIARELNILTVAIVTMPFRAEGPRRKSQAAQGIDEIRKHVDSLLIIDNENINRMYGDLSFSEAFGKADDILATAAKGIAEVITKEFGINVDFADVQTTMSNSGIALMGSSSCHIDSSDDIAQYLTDNALVSPLLNQNNIAGATNILVNISWNDQELRMSDVHKIISIVQESAGADSNVIWGAGPDETITESGEIGVIIIATGFDFAKRLDAPSDNDDIVIDVKPIVRDAQAEQSVVEPSSDEPKSVISIDYEEDQIEIEAASPSNDEPQLIKREDYVVLKDVQVNIDNATSSNERVVVSLYDEPEEAKKEVSFADDDEFEVVEKIPQNVAQAQKTSRVRHDVNTGVLFEGVEDDMFVQNVAPQRFVREVATNEMSVDEQDEVPAFIRRQMLASVNVGSDKKVTRLSVKDDK